MRVEVVSTSMSSESKSRELLARVRDALVARGAEVGWTDLRDLPPVLADGRETGQYPEPYGQLYRRLQEANGVVIAMPVYCSSMSGPCKNLVDIVAGALQSKPVAVVSAGGSPRSHLAVRDLMTCLIFECAAYIYPGTPQVTDGAEKGLGARVSSFADGFLHMVRSLGEMQHDD